MGEKLAIQIESFTPRRANTLRGFCSVLIPALRLRIHDLPIHEKNGARWASMPGKPQITTDGAVRRDERGKVLYSSVLEFQDKATRDAFSARVVEAVEAIAPEVFDRGTA